MRWQAMAALSAAIVLSGGTAAKTFRLATVQDAATLDPHANNSTSTTILVGQICEPLIYRTPDLSLAPDLAVRWQQVEPTRWRFTLREGARFAAGEAFTAEDAAFSIARARRHAHGA